MNVGLFISIPLSNYQMNREKLMQIKCSHDRCTFKGNIIEWIQIFVFPERGGEYDARGRD